MHVFLDLTGGRIDGGEIALIALIGSAEPAVPASFLVVLFSIDRNAHAGRHRRYVQELRIGAVGRRPVIVAAGRRRADLLKRLSGSEVANPSISLDILGGIVIERLAGLLVDSLGPIGLHVGLGQQGLAVAALIRIEEAVARRMGDELARL